MHPTELNFDVLELGDQANAPSKEALPVQDWQSMEEDEVEVTLVVDEQNQELSGGSEGVAIVSQDDASAPTPMFNPQKPENTESRPMTDGQDEHLSFASVNNLPPAVTDQVMEKKELVTLNPSEGAKPIPTRRHSSKGPVLERPMKTTPLEPAEEPKSKESELEPSDPPPVVNPLEQLRLQDPAFGFHWRETFGYIWLLYKWLLFQVATRYKM